MLTAPEAHKGPPYIFYITRLQASEKINFHQFYNILLLLSKNNVTLLSKNEGISGSSTLFSIPLRNISGSPATQSQKSPPKSRSYSHINLVIFSYDLDQSHI